MKRKDLVIFLLLELSAGAVAGLSFALIERRLVAGAVAGSWFVATGLFMLSRAARWPDKWRSLTWYPLLVHVFGISLPLVISRFAQMGSAFEDVRILGLEGPVFHRLSTGVFWILMGATLIDLFRAWRAERAARAN